MENEKIQKGIATVIQRALVCSYMENIFHDPEQTQRHFMGTVYSLAAEGYGDDEIKQCLSMAQNLMVHAGDVKYPYPNVEE